MSKQILHAINLGRTIELNRQGTLNKLKLYVRPDLMELYRLPAEESTFVPSIGGNSEAILSGHFITNKGTDFCLTSPVLFWSSKYFNPLTGSYLWAALPTRIINGASIPKLAWSIVGSPFSGRYKRSAAIHDVECQDTDTDYQTVHALFAEMIEVEGVHGWKKSAMAKAVKWRGPRW